MATKNKKQLKAEIKKETDKSIKKSIKMTRYSVGFSINEKGKKLIKKELKDKIKKVITAPAKPKSRYGPCNEIENHDDPFISHIYNSLLFALTGEKLKKVNPAFRESFKKFVKETNKQATKDFNESAKNHPLILYVDPKKKKK